MTHPFPEVQAARQRDPHIGVRVEAGRFTIVRAVPRKGRSHDVTVLAGPMAGFDAMRALQRFADTGSL